VRIALSNPDVRLTGGVERAVTETANQLVSRDHEVTVYAARVDRSVLDDRVRVRTIEVPLRLDARTGFGFRHRCAQAIAVDAPDVHGAFGGLSPLGGVLWVPSVHREAYELLLSRRGFGGRLSIQLHPYHWVRLRLEKSMFRAGGYSLILVQTEAVRAEILRSYGEVTKLEFLPWGYDDATFNPIRRLQQRDEARRFFGYAPDDRVLLFAANELERKGFEVLLAALRKVPEAKLLGDGRETPKPGMFESYGVGERVQWRGHPGGISMLHAAADVLVLPTRYEPWGLVIVEALGSGLPVVTSRLAGASMAVQDRRTGMLLDDPEDADSLAEGIRWALSGAPAPPEAIAASVRDYAWDQVIGRYEAALTEVARRA
jgi:UDP-glucose:(heptosyl)LPS alpha-1,3-glucosyltransferase